MDTIDTLNPVLIYATLTASCALRKNLTFSKIKWIISLIALLLYICEIVAIVSVSHFIEKQNRPGLLNGPTLRAITKLCNRMSNICTGMVNQLHILSFSHRNFVYVTQTLFHVDGVLKTSDEQHKKDRRIIWCYLACPLIFLSQSFYYGYIYFIEFNLTILVVYVFSVYINYGITSSELEYIALFQIIRSRFNIINTSLKNLKQQLKNGPQHLTNNLELLRLTHLTLVRLAQRTNSIYNIRLFFSFMCGMMNVLTNLYLMSSGVSQITAEYDDYQDVSKTFKSILNLLLGALFYIVRLTMLCLASQLLCKEANATVGKVSKMMRYACNAGLKDEMMLFQGSLSLTQIDLKVAGLAKMDVKLIVRVIASAITILVTLAQIQNQKS